MTISSLCDMMLKNFHMSQIRANVCRDSIEAGHHFWPKTDMITSRAFRCRSHLDVSAPKIPQIPFAFEFECNQPHGNSVNFGKR